MKVIITDGGRAAAGFKGDVGDCVVRSIAIAARLPYREIYDNLSDVNARTPKSSRRQHGKHLGVRTASHGIFTKSTLFKNYMRVVGFVWVPTMQIGSGCKVHLRSGELPMGRLVVSVSKHYTAVIDGVIHDNHNPTRGGKRCVYGYWKWKGGDK